MSDSEFADQDAEGMSREELMSALFAQMVMQQANLAMMLMGKVPHPQTKEKIHDLEGARLFIDQLEMLQAKTHGNLSPEEDRLLKESLMSLQMAFVEVAGAPAESSPAKKPEAKPEPKTAGVEPASGGAAGTEDEGRKRFSKKY